jgi:hypothetical protein
MSRSRRKTSVTGITTADSDKRDKVLAHRRQRRQAGDVWNFAKDGKQRFDPHEPPKLIRK